jgi:HSP20 family protein
MLGRKGKGQDKGQELARKEDSPAAAVDRWPYPWDEFDRMFDDLFTDRWMVPFMPRAAMGGAMVPRVDITDEGDHLLIAADMPGVPKEAVEVEVHDGRLSIRSSVSEETKDEGKDYIRRERRRSAWSRSFALPEGVKDDAVEAAMKDGVLRVKVPKAKVEEPKKVQVKVE